MKKLKLYYATNRRHIGRDRWKPSGYSTKFSDDGMENLRFGVVELDADEEKIGKYLKSKVKDTGTGNGVALSNYLSKQVKSAEISAFPEVLSKNIAEKSQKKIKLGSKALFKELQVHMEASNDVLVYIHGFNVSWRDAVGAALALQLMQSQNGDSCKEVVVVLFTWPSDGLALPWVSYKSDRSEAKGSGAAVGRAILKLRDFLMSLRDKAKDSKHELCGQEIHLLCHSMGNYLLAETLVRMRDFTAGSALPRIFHNVFLCAPDVDDDALEEGGSLGSISQIAREVTLYHNRGDFAMVTSDYTKGQPERLGGHGAARPGLLHNKVHQVDCSPVVHGLVEHSYYLVGNINADIRSSIDGLGQNSSGRKRQSVRMYDNVWEMVP